MLFTYFYENENNVPSFNIKNDKQKLNQELQRAFYTSKPTTTSMRENGIAKYANAQTTMCTQYINNNVVAIESS